ncbi:MAG: CpsD/CapB family tyrosine-protein kinase [Dehalococcoidia bacterium]|nr:CpsD/CapB family tyrosine-protein kinase [Dehalococcoidia bacterium]
MKVLEPDEAQQAIHEHTRAELQEAIREVQLLAGLDRNQEVPEPTLRPVTIGVTSPEYRDGKTTIAIALAASLGHDLGSEVTLVDADLHTHSLARQYRLNEEAGFSELLAGSVSLDEATYRLGGSTVRVVPAGKPTADPGRVARSNRLGPVLEAIRNQSAHVVLDLPSVLNSMNTPALATRCDGVIIVVRHGKTTRAQLDRTLHLLRDANVIGVVVNRHRTSIPGWVQRSLGLRP